MRQNITKSLSHIVILSLFILPLLIGVQLQNTMGTDTPPIDEVNKLSDNKVTSSDWSSEETSALVGFNFRKNHTILGAVGAGTDYQVKIQVYYGFGTDLGSDVYLGENCQVDFDDIRFTDDDGTTLLDYWREEYYSGDNATFWVEIKDNLDFDQSIYLYYGNSTCDTTSDGVATFLFFDDFSDSLDTEKWTVSQGNMSVSGDFLQLEGTSSTRGNIYSTSFSAGVNTSYTMKGYADSSIQENQHILNYRDIDGISKADIYGGDTTNELRIISKDFDDTDTVQSEYGYTLTSVHQYSVFRDSGSDHYWFIDGDQVAHHNTDVDDSEWSPKFTEGTDIGDVFYVDWCFVRKTVASEPTHDAWEDVVVDESPEINPQEDIEYELGSTGHWINWSATDENPDWYEVFQDGELVHSGTWESGVLEYSVPNDLGIGIYNFTIVVYDTSGNSASDTVIVTVLASTEATVLDFTLISITIGSLTIIVVIGSIICRNRS